MENNAKICTKITFMTFKRTPWRHLSVLLVASGIGWVGYLLVTSFQDSSQLLPDSIGWLSVSTILVALSLAMNILLFGLFLNATGTARYPYSLIVQLQLIGQILRYLPGRIWGIAYQISSTREQIPAVRLARANIDFMVFSLLGSTVIAILLLGYQRQWSWWSLTSIGLGGLLLSMALFLGGANWFLQSVAAFLPKKFKNKFLLLAEGQISLPRLLLGVFLFSISWAIYLLGWTFLGKTFHSFSQVDFISLCAYYTLASVVGLISAITPAGLGVREATFVLLASGSFENEALAFFALFGRLWLLLIEIGLILLAAPFLLITKGK